MFEEKEFCAQKIEEVKQNVKKIKRKIKWEYALLALYSMTLSLNALSLIFNKLRLLSKMVRVFPSRRAGGGERAATKLNLGSPLTMNLYTSNCQHFSKFALTKIIPNYE